MLSSDLSVLFLSVLSFGIYSETRRRIIHLSAHMVSSQATSGSDFPRCLSYLYIITVLRSAPRQDVHILVPMLPEPPTQSSVVPQILLIPLLGVSACPCLCSALVSALPLPCPCPRPLLNLGCNCGLSQWPCLFLSFPGNHGLLSGPFPFRHQCGKDFSTLILFTDHHCAFP